MSGVRAQWSRRLAAAASRGDAVLPGAGASQAERLAFIGGFVGDYGHRRPVDAAFLACLLGLEGSGLAAGGSHAPDVELWSMCARGDSTPLPPWLDGSGPLTPGHQTTAIEIWTETELACLHALWRLARSRAEPRLRGRCLDAAEWHLRELHPDNVTGHPWGVHVFAELADMRNNPDAQVHAELMLHASMIDGGRPDRFSACVLIDAARELSTG